MPQRHALFLDLTHVSAYSWHGGTLRPEGRFAGDAPGTEAFVEFLRRHRSSIYYLIADVSEEGYQIEDVPYVQGRDRQALIERRLAQYFFGTPLAAAISLGRDKTGRRDEKIMFTALTRPQHFEPWLEAIGEAEVALAGIYSLPLVIANLFHSLQRRSGRYLLLSLSNSGLRQSFLVDGQLRFSRLTPLATDPIAEFSSACAIEAEKIYQYLIGQREIERGQRLETLVLCHPSQLENLRRRCHNTDELRFDFVDLTAVSHTIGLKTPPEDSRSELLFTHLLLKKPPPWQFAPAPARRFYRLWQWRTAINAAAVVILASCVLFGIKAGVQTYALRQQTESLSTATAIDQRKYEAVLKTLPPVPVSADQLRNLVSRYEELEKHSPQIDTTLQQISRALETSPRVDLRRIDWRASPTADAAMGSVSQSNAQAAGAGYFVIAELQAQLPQSMADDHRAILETVERFVADLKKNKAMEVRILHMPFDLASGQSIKSSTQAGTTQVEAPKFALRLVQAV